MRILLVNWQDLDNPQAGGAEIHLFELFGRLVGLGHQVHLVCSGWKGGQPRATVRGLTVERHGDRHSFAVVGRRAVRRAAAAFRPDIVVEDINKLPLYTASLTTGPSAVIVPHLFGTTAYAEAGWAIATAVVVAERAIPWAYRRSSFHVISESTRDDLVARGIAPERIVVIHPGVDTVNLVPGQEDQVRHNVFLYLGRLKRYKGVEVAIRALAIARRDRPDLRLEIAGAGDDRPRLEGLVRELGQPDAVEFLGFVPDAAKRRLFQTVAANVFPSPKEGWGITVMEAAACGTPSLASDSPGLRDSVAPGVTGFLVPHGDAAAMARRMLELAGNPVLAAAMGRAARSRAEAWPWEAAATATLKHLERTVTGWER